MTMYVQHGYGKSDKIQRLLEDGLAAGVVLSPANEGPNALAMTAANARALGAELLVDPQLYVSTILGGTANKHEENSLDFSSTSSTATSAAVQAHVSQVLNLNHRVGSSAVIAPAPAQTAFQDAWTSVADLYAQVTIQSADKPVYVSVVVDERGLADWTPISHWLDHVTTFDCEGFYLIIAREDGSYPQIWDAALLTNLLRIVYRLSVLNDYTVIWGYADIAGLASLAAGATAFGCGWFYSLRNFKRSKWTDTAGRTPKARVLSHGLLTPVEARDEGSRLAGSAISDIAFPDQGLRSQLQSPDSVNVGVARMQHLQALGALAKQVSGGGPPTTKNEAATRVAYVDGLFSDARRNLDEADRLGLTLTGDYMVAVKELQKALKDFAQLENVV